MGQHADPSTPTGADTITATPRRAVVAACAGNFIEYYDFVVYGYFATTIAALFFPAKDATASLLLTFAAFAVSYAARPLGAVHLRPNRGSIRLEGFPDGGASS